MSMRPERVGLSVTLALHVLAAVFLLSYEPARKALLAVAPIMVDLITPPVVEPPKPALPLEPPKPKPVARVKQPLPVPKPAPVPILAVPAEAPSPVVVAPPPPSPVEVAGASGPALTQPIYNADYLDNPPPAYPSMSRRAGEQGRVVLRVLVSAGGTADEVQVFTSSGFPRLDEAARDAVRRWKFVPAKRGSEPMQTWVRIPIPFVLREG
jgi:protein TonB